MARPPAAGFGKPGAQRDVVDKQLQLCRERRRIAGWEQQARILAAHGCERRDIAGHYGAPRSHRLHENNAKGLTAEVRRDEDVGTAQDRCFFIFGDSTGKFHALYKTLGACPDNCDPGPLRQHRHSAQEHIQTFPRLIQAAQKDHFHTI